MSLLLAWVAFPLAAVALALGWGVLAELATGRPLPRALLAPLGLAAIVVVSQILTSFDATAELAPTAVAVGGVAGLLARRRRLRIARSHGWQIAAATAVFAAYAAPVVLSGSATFAGYGQLGDIADHFVIADAMLRTGANAADPARSAYDMAVAAYPGQGYPTGMHTALGSLRSLAGQDVAWVHQPFLALVMALAALSLLALVRSVLRSPWARAVAVVAATLAPLTYGFALQGAIKEIGAFWLLALLGGLLAWYADAAPGPRRAIPVALVAAAALAVIGVAIGAWLAPLLLAFLLVAVRRDGRWQPRAAALEVAAFAVVAVVAALPALAQLDAYLGVVVDVVRGTDDRGNLLTTLSNWQVLPAWPSLEFRVVPSTATGWLAVGATGAIVALGGAALLRRPGRHRTLLAWVLVMVGGCAITVRAGSPWADAKALAILAPAVALVAAIGALALLERGLRAEGAAVAIVLAATVVWSIGLQVRGASLAPRERLEELAQLGSRLRGPTLHPQFEPFAKYFLRDAEADSLTEPYPAFRSPPLLRAGAVGRPLGFSYDLDDLAPRYVQRFRTIVVRRGPGSRPPAIYRRVWRGRWYEAWERPAGSQRRWIGSVGAGTEPSAAGRPDCARVRALARAARRSDGRLVAHPRRRALVWLPARSALPLPADWGPDGTDPLTLVASRPGSVRGTLEVPAGDRYALWLAGSIGAKVTVSIDGRDVGRLVNGIQPRGQYLPIGTVRLRAGPHAIALRRDGAGLRAGAEGGSRLIGALVLEPAGAGDGPLATVAPERASTLCTRSVDWVQALAP